MRRASRARPATSWRATRSWWGRHRRSCRSRSSLSRRRSLRVSRARARAWSPSTAQRSAPAARRPREPGPRGAGPDPRGRARARRRRPAGDGRARAARGDGDRRAAVGRGAERCGARRAPAPVPARRARRGEGALARNRAQDRRRRRAHRAEPAGGDPLGDRRHGIAVRRPACGRLRGAGVRAARGALRPRAAGGASLHARLRPGPDARRGRRFDRDDVGRAPPRPGARDPLARARGPGLRGPRARPRGRRAAGRGEPAPPGAGDRSCAPRRGRDRVVRLRQDLRPRPGERVRGQPARRERRPRGRARRARALQRKRRRARLHRGRSTSSAPC